MTVPPRLVVGLTRAGDLESPWHDRFWTVVERFVARLVDRDLARRLYQFARSLHLTRYRPHRPAPMSAIFYPNEAEIAFLDGALDGDGGRFADAGTYFDWVVQHELAHVADHVSDYALSAEFGGAVGSTFTGDGADRRYVPGNIEGRRYPTTISGVKSIFEDFAESVAVYVTGGAYMAGESGRVDGARLAACARLFLPEEEGDERSAQRYVPRDADHTGPVPGHDDAGGVA